MRAAAVRVFIDGLPLNILIKKRCFSNVFINDTNIFKFVDNKLGIVFDILNRVRGVQIQHNCLGTDVRFHLSSTITGNIIYENDVLRCGKYFLHVAHNDIFLTLFRRRASKISLVPVTSIKCVNYNGCDRCFTNMFCPIL